MEIHEKPAEQGKRDSVSMDARRCFRCVTLRVTLKWGLRVTTGGSSDAEDTTGKRVPDAAGESFVVVNKAPNGEAESYFDRTRQVWVAPWRKPDVKVGRPTGKTRALSVASRDRHVAKSAHEAQFGDLTEGFTAETSVGGLAAWWLEHVARHRVRPTSLATYRKHASVIDGKLGPVPVCELSAEQVTSFVSDLLDEGSASRAKNVRTLLVQILEQGVEFGLATQNVARKVKAPKAAPKQRRTITPAQTRHLIAECDPRFAAAAALCFVQGWRISEALGLAWQELDLDEGSVLVRRGSTYADRVGMVLGPTKTRGATGVQMLGRTVVSLLRARRDLHEADRAAYPGPWPTVEYDGEQLDLVFTTADGTPTLRQHVDRAIRKAAERADIESAGLGTHAGRRSVVTNLFASGSPDLEDVARSVGHNDVATTRGYVQHEGDRPRQVSERALELLDPRPTEDEA
jgi:integrase